MKHNALLLHHDLKSMFEMLSFEESGRLIVAALEYDIYGTEAQFEDRTLQLCFIRMKDLLDRNREKYEQLCLKRAEAAKKRWEQVKDLNENSEYQLN